MSTSSNQNNTIQTLYKSRILTSFSRQHALLALMACLMAFMLTACQEKPRGPAPLPELSIGVAGFTQPTTVQELMAGYIPEGQTPIKAKDLEGLDVTFAKTLAEGTNRRYLYIPTDALSLKSYKGPAIEYWLELGQAAGVDLLIVPQAIAYTPRIGGDLGVTQAAAVMLDFFLIDVREEILIHRYAFNEQQVGLASNLLEIGTFFSRGGKWLTADELAQEGMVNVIKEFGL
ncbi:MAG: hypothetical protein R3Y11_11535 [Pseudomonadota bacterium]